MATPTFDKQVLLARIDNDLELLHELLTLFIEDAPQQLARIRTASESGDTTTLHRAAHSLKGACANIGAMALRSIAAELEIAAKSGQQEKISPLLSGVVSEYEALMPLLEKEVATVTGR